MGNLINCKDCGKEISKKAKTCPHCGAKVKKKKIGLGIVIGIIALFIIVSAASNGSKTNSNNVSQKSTSANSSTKKDKKSEITKEIYDKIQNNMTKEEVKKLLGEPTSVSESETPGVGKMELYHYQKTFDTKAITITFFNGKVYTKNWTQL